MSQSKSSGKPFEISKWAVHEAYCRVKANKGAAGVDEVSIEEFEADLQSNLYEVWNRMSSGTYFPPPVRAVEIPKASGGGPHSRGADGGGIVPRGPVVIRVLLSSRIRSIR
jgi:hypothetical protein